MSYFRIKGHPILDALVGFTATRAMLRGSLFGTLVETHRIAQAMDEHEQQKVARCTEVARDAAIADAKQTGGDVEHAKAAAVAAGVSCMSGPLLTGTIRPAQSSGDAGTSNSENSPKPRSLFWSVFVFTFAAVLGGVIAYAIVSAILR